MRKTYRYRDLILSVSEEKEVVFSVQFISDGNLGHTTVYLPNAENVQIENSGSDSFGTGKDLHHEIIVGVTDISNPIPEEDTIRVNFLINDAVIVSHSNLKSEEERPIIILYFKFVLP